VIGEEKKEQKLCPVYKCVVDYKAKANNELTIREGDEVAVLDTRGEWMKGKNLAFNHYGWFPQ
jgi:hypothetical protein